MLWACEIIKTEAKFNLILKKINSFSIMINWGFSWLKCIGEFNAGFNGIQNPVGKRELITKQKF